MSGKFYIVLFFLLFCGSLATGLFGYFHYWRNFQIDQDNWISSANQSILYEKQYNSTLFDIIVQNTDYYSGLSDFNYTFSAETYYCTFPVSTDCLQINYQFALQIIATVPLCYDLRNFINSISSTCDDFTLKNKNRTNAIYMFLFGSVFGFAFGTMFITLCCAHYEIKKQERFRRMLRNIEYDRYDQDEKKSSV